MMIKPLEIGQIISNKDGLEQYTITEMIGRGASTIAYLTVCDNGSFKSTRIIKEYCPTYIEAERTRDGRIEYKNQDAERFEKGLSRFLKSGDLQSEIRERASLRNQTPPIIKKFFENNTGYLDVTPFEGVIYEKIEYFSGYERLKICLSIAKLVNLYHQEGFLCLDIKPSNIFVLKETTEIIEFIDFDSVRNKYEIKFGNSLSYTKLWAAPEQVNPYSVDNIKEATDVYTVGEIVFWSLFGRHSNAKEHRKNAKYPFGECVFVEMRRPSVKKLLSYLFNNTIRSSADNRFDSMEPVIEVLEKVVEELQKREVINHFEIFTKEFFVGRSKELETLRSKLNNHKIVFVSGIPGIGKSEIVKQYINIYRNEYQDVLYWFYEGDFEKMICNDHFVSISNFCKEKDETDAEYSLRKIKKLRELVNEQTIIIIDNLDLLIEEVNSSELWNRLKTFPGKMIVTTRSEQQNYEMLKIKEMDDMESLKEIFYNHAPSCQSCGNEDVFVDKIIEAANSHTYEIELLAKHAEAEKKSPKELLEEMLTFGIGKFDETEINSLKDGMDIAATFKEHLEKIFSLNNLSEGQKIILLKLSFIPNGGVDIRQFKHFYSLKEYNSINWLIAHGFINELPENRYMVTIHPSIAEMIVQLTKEDKELLNEFYEDAIRAMRKGYDDETLNKQLVLQVQKEFTREKVSELFPDETFTNEELEKRIELMKRTLNEDFGKSDIEPKEYLKICDSLAYYSWHYKVREEMSARFITQYTQWFSKYGQNDFKRELMKYCIEIYDNLNSTMYFQDREYAYEVYAMLLVKDKKYAEEVISIATKHLKEAIKAKDWKFASNWCNYLARVARCLDKQPMCLKYQLLSFFYSIKTLVIKKNKYDNSFMGDSYSNATCSAWVGEEDYEDLIDTPKGSIISLKMAIKVRNIDREVIPLSANKIKININEAKIKMLQHSFLDAKEELMKVYYAYKENEVMLNEVLFEVFELLGEISTIVSEYDEALMFYEECLEMAIRLGFQDTSRIRIKIGRIYSLCGKLDLSVKHNSQLLEEFEGKEAEISKKYLADIYYNNAELYFIKKEFLDATNYLEKAKILFFEYENLGSHYKIGKARCIALEGKILCSTDREGSHFFRESYEILKEILGENHPETITLRKELI